MKEYAVIIFDDEGNEVILWSTKTDEGLADMKRYLPDGEFYDEERDSKYRIMEREVSEWRDFAGD